jgi:hypothetical protein
MGNLQFRAHYRSVRASMMNVATHSPRLGFCIRQAQVAGPIRNVGQRRHEAFFYPFRGAIVLCMVWVVSSNAILSAELSSTRSQAEYARHVKQVKKRLPSDGFTIVVSPPFVVIGDDEPAEVRRCAKHTVDWTVRLLKEAYFSKDPADILDIWLFKDKESYEKNCKRVFHTTPDTPYGYYSHRDRALVMNIATGGGTLVHEIVHPFVAANFPECPAWFNEGLGSLYEQCGEEDGEIHGYTNWRLPGVQKTIRKKELPSFKTLCSTTSDEFYDKDPGSNYGQARYLCYYLQENGLLRKYYREFRAHCSDDPTGYKTLQRVLGRRDMDAFQKEWEAFVLTLRFR